MNILYDMIAVFICSVNISMAIMKSQTIFKYSIVYIEYTSRRNDIMNDIMNSCHWSKCFEVEVATTKQLLSLSARTIWKQMNFLAMRQMPTTKVFETEKLTVDRNSRGGFETLNCPQTKDESRWFSREGVTLLLR